MKSILAYLSVIVIGGAVGATGMGSYNVFVAGAAADSEEQVADEGAASEVDPGTGRPEGPVGETGGADRLTRTEGVGDEGSVGGVAEAPGGLAEDGSDDSADVDSSDGASVGSVKAPGVTAPTSPPAVTVDPAVEENYQRLARIFMAMRPEEAAPVLAQLDDAQLEGILLAMQGRNAAPILAEMDPARVASISRRVLGGNR